MTIFNNNFVDYQYLPADASSSYASFYLFFYAPFRSFSYAPMPPKTSVLLKKKHLKLHGRLSPPSTIVGPSDVSIIKSKSVAQYI
jgi:hypothetical protein